MKDKRGKRLSVVITTLTLFLQVGKAAYCESSTSAILIADVLTQPDGRQFSGVMSVTPIGFAVNSTPPSITLPIRQKGMFELHLPNTPEGAYYSVHFRSDLNSSWDEKWRIPRVGDKVLRLTDIRESQRGTEEDSDRAVTATTSLPIAVSDVTGLSNSLSVLTSSLAATNSSINSLTSIVNALNSSSTTSQVRGEVPTGNVDGNNTVFTLSYIPVSGSTVLYRNGVRLAVNVDYTIGTNSITFINGEIPQRGDVIVADYVKGAT